MSAHDPFLLARAGRAQPDVRLTAGVAGGGLVSILLVGWLIGGAAALPIAVAAVIGMLIGGGATAFAAARQGQGSQPLIDWTMVRSTLEDGQSGAVISSRSGAMICANSRYEQMFGKLVPPLSLAFADDGVQRLSDAERTSWREGATEVDALSIGRTEMSAKLRRLGQSDEYMLTRFLPSDDVGGIERIARLIGGAEGRRFGKAGVMIVLADPEGRIHACNAAFAQRALGDGRAEVVGMELSQLLSMNDGFVRLIREAGTGQQDEDAGSALRVVPLRYGDEDGDGEGGVYVTMFLLIDEDPEVMSAASTRAAATGHLHELLAMLPLGLALADRDGRLLFANKSFRRAAAAADDDVILYPSDLVCEEDKATVIETVRRFAQGRALPGDLNVRLKHKPDEPVALTIANAKGLGDAAVLLSLKDDSEQSTLKRQVAQATKMQAVGQLAGGVAHDFNNILTAIIGHCDLMAMRHTPGDIDYDDIQQIKNNSNRAAALTRQLLAFSRQQTLRPQVLQLPEVISEITNLVRRLLGETITLDVKHGRNLGLIRADPGQLEQVIVNLAVNARDAMTEGGRLSIETYATSADDVRRMRSEIMPIGDYTSMKIGDTGCGIPIDHIGKIFEPFFTTKEVGKGTGLGLSTVYGIIKQTGGFIFADSEIGRGTIFTIHLPVHHAADLPTPAPVPVEPEASDLWGTGTILLVEDEAMVRAVGERALVRQGYRVLTASNGEDALDILAEETGIDLLISDVVMPGLDGPALVRKARELYPDLRILFMSGYAEEQLRESIDIERVAFLSKPFSVQRLGQTVRDILAV